MFRTATCAIELKPHADKPVRAYEEQFLRLLEKRRCFTVPLCGDGVLKQPIISQ